MKQLIILLAGLLISFQVFSQAVSPVTLAAMPSFLKETSGLELSDSARVWTHNDSGGEAKLYQIDTTGANTRTVVVQGASNIDWEEIAKDTSGWLYIGDFGNNSHNRTNLRIYRIQDPDLSSSDTLIADTIQFNYPDQTAFPPPAPDQNFDMEAMVAVGDSLYLFSKNWSDPFSGYTKMYRLPSVPGTYTAELLDSFYTGPGPDLNFFVTAADLSPDGKKLLLMGQDKCWLFTCFKGHDFFSGMVRTLTFPLIGQREAVVFRDNHRLFISDEEIFAGFGGGLYGLDLRPWSEEPIADLGPDSTISGPVYLLDPGVSGMQYNWSTGDSAETLTADSSGTYWVEMGWNGECLSRDTVELIFSPTALSNIHSNTSIKIIHPFEGKIKIISPEKDVKWVLRNTLGQMIEKGNGKVVSGYANEPGAIYFLEMRMNEKKTVFRIVGR